MEKVILKKDVNKEEFFNKFLKNELDKEVNLKEDKEEDICFLYDKLKKIVVIDGYLQKLETYPDTTNIEEIVKKIIYKIDIKDEFEKYDFIFILKNNPAFFTPISIKTFTKVDVDFNHLGFGFTLDTKQHNFNLKYEYEIEESDGRYSIP
ncbi:hypothetical protein [Aliarcobacter butzleri]|uniref:hypothetical protein n=1 Tax=Aliarcobacter butzleri TaxID=28197 RepID=UPI003B21BF20